MKMESWLTEIPAPRRDGYAAERAIRDAYAARLEEFRPDERVWKTEHTYYPSLLRGDLRTIDKLNRIRVWEFKLKIGYDGLGQVLTYVALARQELKFARPVLGVLAGYEINPELLTAIEVLNLGIEVVILPATMRQAGRVPADTPSTDIPLIPRTVTASPANVPVAREEDN
ncbi:hypothetical protein [Dactylosporangium darangshiense]|uniref:Uncharacterized protein n=1 Tax=Dactylosporangium darangshiense TaxID=579108 RepID=A0ABP8CTI0_9ACTN